MFHCGHFKTKANKVFTTVQLFEMPSEEVDVPCLPQSCLEDQDFTEGHLDESTVLELCNDVMHNWDTRYSVDESCP
jgi:hypothetical protein